LQGDAGRKALRRAGVHLPAHVEPAVGLVVEVGERRRLDRVDGDALAGGEDADDTVGRG
jgi:hypothetical protein